MTVSIVDYYTPTEPPANIKAFYPSPMFLDGKGEHHSVYEIASKHNINGLIAHAPFVVVKFH